VLRSSRKKALREVREERKSASKERKRKRMGKEDSLHQETWSQTLMKALGSSRDAEMEAPAAGAQPMELEKEKRFV
jgi:uncharacterized membrane protein